MSDGKRASYTLLISVIAMIAANYIIAFIGYDGDVLRFYALNALVLSIGAIYLPSMQFMRGVKGAEYGKRKIGSMSIMLSVLLGIAVFLVSSSVNTGLSILFTQIGIKIPSGLSPDFEGWRIIGTIIVMCVVPAVAEEQLFHGALLNAWRPFGRTKAILMSAVVFTLMHCNPTSIPSLFISCLALGVVAFDTRSVYPAMIMHFTNNFMSYITYGLASTDNVIEDFADNTAAAVSAAGGTAVSLTTAALLVVYLIVGVLLFVFTYKRLMKSVPGVLTSSKIDVNGKERLLGFPLAAALILLIAINMYSVGVFG